METKFTPGPWSPNLMAYRQTVYASDGVVADVIEADRTRDVAQANTYLIASAPDLFALAVKVAAHFADTDAPLGIEARAALKKAGA